LGQDIAAVLAGSGPLERRLNHEEARAYYLVRLAPYQDSDQRIGGVVVSFVDVTGLTQAEDHQRILIAELQHRTRNLLNVVQAIVLQTLGRKSTPQILKDRLAALGRVQSLVSKSKDDEVDLAEVVRLELRAYAGEEEGRVTINGPSLALGYERIQTLALALHELTTNAVKHGALNGSGGRLNVCWAVKSCADGVPLLVLDWRESGVIMPSDVSRRGYGRELIERALTYTSRAKTQLTFGADGVACRIEMPLARRAAAPRS
jgi:two-component system CheB/CheR fusion protein